MCSTEASSCPHFYDLNKDCFLLTAEFIDRSSLRKLSQTCRKFRNVIHSTSSLDTRQEATRVVVWYVDQLNYLTVHIYRAHGDMEMIKLSGNKESESSTGILLDELPLTFSQSRSHAQESFYSENDYRLRKKIWISSQDDVARLFDDMSQFVAVDRFALEHFYSTPKPFVWLIRILLDTFPGVPLLHSLVNVDAEELRQTLRPFIDFWVPNFEMRYICSKFGHTQQEEGATFVDLQRFLQEAVVDLMRETNRTADIVHERRPSVQHSPENVDVKLSEDKTTLTFVINS